MKPMLFVRGVIQSVTTAAGRLMRFTASGRTAETFTDREALQQYGLQTRPPVGAECLVVKQGEHVLLIASDDRRYRISLQDGEVALVTDEGDAIHMRRNHTIEVRAQRVFLGPEVAAELGGGVVTVMCQCAYTGAIHPIGSSKVKAQK